MLKYCQRLSFLSVLLGLFMHILLVHVFFNHSGFTPGDSVQQIDSSRDAALKVVGDLLAEEESEEEESLVSPLINECSLWFSSLSLADAPPVVFFCYTGNDYHSPPLSCERHIFLRVHRI